MSLEGTFRSLDAASIVTLLAASSEIALLVDRHGVVEDVSVPSAELAAELGDFAHWLGKTLDSCVTIDGKNRVGLVVRQIESEGGTRRIHLNHPMATGPALPVLYTFARVGADGKMIALGRDLRSVSALQQKLVDAQQSLDREYLRLRHLETRYRLLFEMTSEAVVILEARNFRIVEANGPARILLGGATEQALSKSFHELFDASSAEVVQANLVLVRMAGRGDQISARLAAHGTEITFTAWLFRQEENNLLLVRLHETEVRDSITPLSRDQVSRLAALDRAPDGFVIMSESGRILSVNAAFIDLVQVLNEDQAIGAPLDQWLGRPGVDLNVLIANLRQRGAVKLFATTLRGQFGSTSDVEISAVSLPTGGDTQFALTIRDVGRRLAAEPRAGQETPRSVEQLMELIGRVPLKDLVRESTDMIERLCIEAALNLTGDNRASAAELLGLSRQSLYVKLRRYGLGELADNE